MKLVWILGLSASALFGQSSQEPGSCKTLIGQFFPHQSRLKVGSSSLDIRVCEPSGMIQLMARGGSGAPLLVDTNRTSVSSIVMAGDIVVIETAGASSNMVHVFEFKPGSAPRILYENAFKQYLHAETSYKEVVLYLAGDGPLVLRFATGRD